MEQDFASTIDQIKDRKWVSDEDAPACMNCDVQFSLTNRRHHCRACGGVFCSKCSDKKRPLPHLGLPQQQRVCDSCFDDLSQKHPVGECRTMLGETLSLDETGIPQKPLPFGRWDASGVLWNSSSVGKIVSSSDEEIQTIHELFQRTVSTFSSCASVGQREFIARDFEADPKNPDRKFEKLTLGEYSFISYAQWGERVKNFGAGLRQFANLEPTNRVLIYAETQQDWMTSFMACHQHNLPVVTAYATLGPDGAAFALNQTKTTTVIADAKLLKVILKIHSRCPALTHVVALGKVGDDAKAKLNEDNIQVATMEELVSQGKDNPIDFAPPTSRDTAVIMFTSGTTGNPKGVLLTHTNLLAAVAGLSHWVGALTSENDTFIAYLPLAHIMEIVSELAFMSVGARIGYGTPHTLTNTGVKLKEGQLGDLVVLKPTVVVFAPLVLEKIYNSIQAKVANSGKFKGWMFQQAMTAGLRNFDNGIVGAPPLWNRLVFNNIQMIAGGKLRLIVTGSAPLDSNVHKFIQTCFGCPVRQGYGATETAAASFVQELNDNTPSSVGPPRVACCMRLVDWEEGGYRVADKNDPAIGKPRGEIVIGGALVSMGYLVDEENPDPELVEKNRTEFVVDDNGVRWFHTGDIGQVDSNGCLAIIDRKKDLVKLQQGEYVALSKVEGVLKLSPYVDNALVHVRSSESYCVALICPSEPALVKLGKEKGWGSDPEELCSNPSVVAEVLASVKTTAKGKLVGFETPTKVALIPPSQAWTPENDLLTAAMKLKRKPIAKAHEKELEALYA